jgi:hypothetical protein
VCSGEIHRYEVTRAGNTASGIMTIAEYTGSAGSAYNRIVSPTPAEIETALNHAFQAGQDYEIARQREQSVTDSEDPPVPEGCPVCDGECECDDDTKKARAGRRAQFAVDGPGSAPRPVKTYTQHHHTPGQFGVNGQGGNGAAALWGCA